MFLLHPLCLAASLAGSLVYSALLKGKGAMGLNLIYLLPFTLLMALINPAFNHAGATILFYLKSGNPLTLESVLYGLAAAAMFTAVILWLGCFNAVMTADKIIYLFGQIAPALSLVLSMTLRLVPRYRAQIKLISAAQQGIGRNVTGGTWARRAGNGLQILSIMTTWALENAVETADAMRSRGYGLPGRTSFSIFCLDRRDKVVGGAMLLLIALILTGGAAGYGMMRFFPTLRLPPLHLYSIAVYLAYFVLCILPILIDLVEGLRWRYIESGR